MQVLSQLEMPQKGNLDEGKQEIIYCEADAYQLDNGTNTTISSEERRKALCIEDEIEFPAFNNEGDTVDHLSMASVPDLAEENIRDPKLTSILPTVGNVKRYEARDTWSEANREVQALVLLNENIGSSKVCKSSKDSRSKIKPKYLFRFQSQKEDLPSFVSDKNEIDMSVTDLPHGKKLDSGGNTYIQKSMAEVLDEFKGGEAEQPLNCAIPSGGAIYYDYNENSAAEFLDSLQEKSGPPQGSCEMPNRLRRRTQVAVSRSAYIQGDTNIWEDSLLNGGSSTDNEGASLHPKPVFQQRTMADRFHEALGAVSPNYVTSGAKFHRQSGILLFDKLQHVIQSEKERDMDFLESCNINAISRDGRSCIDVRILSRSLEAKHTVCCCSLVQDKESSQLVTNFHKRKQIGEKTLTIIFCSRICGDFELEVGNLIRIQPPWKEVTSVVKGVVIILSTYFSQLGS